MADHWLASRWLGWDGFGLVQDGLLEGAELIRGKNEQERLQKDDALPQASINVVMVSVHSLPCSFGIRGGAVEKVRGGVAIIGAEILHHFAQGTDLGEKLETVGEQDVVQKAAHASRFLALLPLKICGVKRGGVGNSAVVFGVFIEGAEQAAEGSSKQETKSRGNTDGLKGFDKKPVLPQLESFVEGDTKHNVIGFECFDVVAENKFLFSGQPSAPVVLDRRSAG